MRDYIGEQTANGEQLRQQMPCGHLVAVTCHHDGSQGTNACRRLDKAIERHQRRCRKCNGQVAMPAHYVTYKS